MVKLTPELIEDSYQYVNPVREYELSLRGTIQILTFFGPNLKNYAFVSFFMFQKATR